jgi:16S rRNA (uracil1498-N3)-methyltransferase
MPRIFVNPGEITGDTVVLPEAEAKRLLRVLRMHTGDAVTLFDGSKEYSSTITTLGTKSATLTITGTSDRNSEPPVAITLGQGLPKGDKLEWVVQKAVELGVSAVMPVLMERSIRRPDARDIEKQLQRLRKIAVEAAQQSGRLCVPEIPCMMDLPMFLQHSTDADLKIVLYEGEKTAGLRNILHSIPNVKSVYLLIGPEGGLKEEEVAEAEAAGFIPAGLGPRILRTETAGLAALSIIQFELGDMG